VAEWFGQRADGLFDYPGLFRGQHRLLRPDVPALHRGIGGRTIEHRLAVLVHLVLLAVGPLLAEREGGVDRDPMQPGGDLRVAAKRIELANHLQEDVLGDVLGVGIVAEHAPGDVINARRVLAEHEFGSQRFGSGRTHSATRAGTLLYTRSWPAA